MCFSYRFYYEKRVKTESHFAEKVATAVFLHYYAFAGFRNFSVRFRSPAKNRRGAVRGNFRRKFLKNCGKNSKNFPRFFPASNFCEFATAWRTGKKRQKICAVPRDSRERRRTHTNTSPPITPLAGGYRKIMPRSCHTTLVVPHSRANSYAFTVSGYHSL